MIRCHSTPKIRRWLSGIVVLAALAPSVGSGEPKGTGSAANNADPGATRQSGWQGGKSNQRAHKSDQHNDKIQHGWADSRQHRGGAAASAQNSTAKTSLKNRRRATATETSVAARALAPAGLPTHFTPYAASPGPVATVSGNAVARHTTVSAAVGGPITYDVKHGALVIIGGTAMSRPPHFRTGELR
jgi:hypothetical protein